MLMQEPTLSQDIHCACLKIQTFKTEIVCSKKISVFDLNVHLASGIAKDYDIYIITDLCVLVKAPV